MRKILYIVVVAAMVLLAACQAAPEPVAQPATEGTAAEAAATEAAAEAPAGDQAAAVPAAGELAAPIPYPEGTVLAGSREPVKFDIDQIVDHRSFDKYCEPEYLTKLVEEGKLPPVEERLPKEPFVYKTGFHVGWRRRIWRHLA